MSEKTRKIVVSGKRKTSVARALIEEGKGKVTINKINYNNLEYFNRMQIEEILRIAKEVLGSLDFNVTITARSGGEKGQIEAAKLSLAKAIVEFSKSKELRRAYLDYDKHFLVADTRRKEMYKPGDSKARSKRQSSYR
jgi:small subunit ribosomal protein S9